MWTSQPIKLTGLHKAIRVHEHLDRLVKNLMSCVLEIKMSCVLETKMD